MLQLHAVVPRWRYLKKRTGANHVRWIHGCYAFLRRRQLLGSPREQKVHVVLRRADYAHAHRKVRGNHGEERQGISKDVCEVCRQRCGSVTTGDRDGTSTLVQQRLGFAFIRYDGVHAYLVPAHGIRVRAPGDFWSIYRAGNRHHRR